MTMVRQDAMGAYIWAWLYYAYVKFVMCMEDMLVVQWYWIFEMLVEMCEVVGVELYWKMIGKIIGVVCDVAGFLQRVVFLFFVFFMLVIESKSVNSGTDLLIENVCIK